MAVDIKNILIPKDAYGLKSEDTGISINGPEGPIDIIVSRKQLTLIDRLKPHKVEHLIHPKQPQLAYITPPGFVAEIGLLTRRRGLELRMHNSVQVMEDGLDQGYVIATRTSTVVFNNRSTEYENTVVNVGDMREEVLDLGQARPGVTTVSFGGRIVRSSGDHFESRHISGLVEVARGFQEDVRLELGKQGVDLRLLFLDSLESISSQKVATPEKDLVSV